MLAGGDEPSAIVSTVSNRRMDRGFRADFIVQRLLELHQLARDDRSRLADQRVQVGGMLLTDARSHRKGLEQCGDEPGLVERLRRRRQAVDVAQGPDEWRLHDTCRHQGAVPEHVSECAGETRSLHEVGLDRQPRIDKLRLDPCRQSSHERRNELAFADRVAAGDGGLQERDDEIVERRNQPRDHVPWRRRFNPWILVRLRSRVELTDAKRILERFELVVAGAVREQPEIGRYQGCRAFLQPCEQAADIFGIGSTWK